MDLDFEGWIVTYDVGELDEVALAYAATVHKSQGAEYPVVVIGQPRALAIVVRNVRATQRLTNLAARLRHGERVGGKPESL